MINFWSDEPPLCTGVVMTLLSSDCCFITDKEIRKVSIWNFIYLDRGRKVFNNWKFVAFIRAALAAKRKPTSKKVLLQLSVFYQSEIPHLHLKDVILDSLSTWYQNNLKWHTRRFKDLFKTQVDFHHAGILPQRDFNTTYLVILYPIARSVFKI